MQKQPHILVIRLSAMGDVAMVVPLINALRKQHPHCSITILSKPFLEPLFTEIPNVSFFKADIKGRHKGVLGLYQLFKQLQKLHITHVADLHNVLRSKILRFFFGFTASRIEKINKGRAEKKALTRSHKKVFKQLKTSVQRYADVFQSLGFEIDLNQNLFLPKKELSKNVLNIVGNKNQDWVGIAPFAAHKGKIYPLDLMQEVIQEASKSSQLLLFGGGSKEIQLLNEWENKFPNTISIAGKLTFAEELKLISNLNLMLSMDSGNGHLAALFNVPTVTLWGMTHPFAGFAPFKQEKNCLLPDLNQYPKLPSSVYGNKMIEGYEDAMRSIHPQTILDKIKRLLK